MEIEAACEILMKWMESHGNSCLCDLCRNTEKAIISMNELREKHKDMDQARSHAAQELGIIASLVGYRLRFGSRPHGNDEYGAELHEVSRIVTARCQR